MAFHQTAQVVTQFLEAVAHTVLYYRNVYPPTSFENTQLYGMVVHQNRHPLVGDYIREAMVKATSSTHVLCEVRIIIHGDDGARLPQGEKSTRIADEERPKQDENKDGNRDEMYRLVFSPSVFPFDPTQTALDDSKSPIRHDKKIDANHERQAEKLKWYRMQDDFKATLLRLEVLCRAQPVPCVDDPEALARRTFRIQLVTRPCGEKSEAENDWMVIQRPVPKLGPQRATPVHRVRLVEGFNVSIRIE